MEREWWIREGEKSVGPFSLRDLDRYRGFTPDSWVRREGESQWRLARSIPELRPLFKEKGNEERQGSKEEGVKVSPYPSSLILSLRRDPHPIGWFLLLAVLLALYLYYTQLS